MTDKTRYALIDATGNVINVTNIGLIFEKVPKIEDDGVTVTWTDTQVETIVIPVQDMIVPGDKYLNGQFVKSSDSITHLAVIRSRDGVILHFVDFPPDVAAVIPDQGCVASPCSSKWDGEMFSSIDQKAT